MTQACLWDAPPRPSRAVTPAAVEAKKVRPYQEETLSAIAREHEQVRSTLVVSATGTGKTVVIAEKARRTTGRVLVLSDRDDLLSQNRDEIAAWTGEFVGLEQADSRAWGAHRIVMASVPSLKGARLKRFAEEHRFEEVIADEAHHAPSPSWRAVIAAFPDAKVTGFTATPRPKGMGAVFDSIAYEYDIADGKRDGWLVGMDVATPVGGGINLDGVRAAAGELVASDVDAEVAKHVRDICECLLTKAEGQRTVIFTPGVLTAHAAAQLMNGLKPGWARSIDGKMDRDECDRIKKAHQAGEFHYLFNCQKLIEGYNDRCLMAVLISAVLRSSIRFVQMVGRGTRSWPGTDQYDTAAERIEAIARSPKPRLLLLDPGYNSERHDLASPVDLVGGALDDEERKVAKRILREKGGAPEDAVAEAKNRVAEQKARIAAIAAAAVRVRSRMRLGEPRDLFQMIRVRKAEHVPFVRPEDRPTAGQVGLFKRWGLPIPATKREWRKVMGIDKQREKRGQCRLAGVHWLARYGVNGWPLSSVQARRVRAAIADNGYRSLSSAQIDALMARNVGEDDA